MSSENVVADLGTRRGATINDILPGSKWDIGLPWMTKDVSQFPGMMNSNFLQMSRVVWE